MNFSETVHDVMQLGHGTSEQLFLIRDYEKHLRAYSHAPLAHPVIVLFDNDDGAKSLFGYAKNKGHPKIGLDSTEAFCRACRHLGFRRGENCIHGSQPIWS